MNASPDAPGPLLVRADCLLRLRRPEPALRDFANPVVARSTDARALANHARRALCLPQIGNAAGHRRFMSVWDADAEEAAAVSLLSPGRPVRPSLLNAAFRKAVDSRGPVALRTLGGLLLREGRAAEAVHPLRMALALRAKDNPPIEEALLSLACHAWQLPDEARQWLARASDRLDRRSNLAAAADWIGSGAVGPWALVRPRLPLDEVGFDLGVWDEWFDADTLRHEAEIKIRR